MTGLRGRVLAVVGLLGVVGACASAEDAGTSVRAEAEDRTVPSSAVETAHDGSTQTQAQALLDDAERNLVVGSTGRFGGVAELGVPGVESATLLLRGVFDFAQREGRYEIDFADSSIDSTRTDVRIFGGDININVESDEGGFGGCWVRVEAPDPIYADRLVLPATEMLLEPAALGMLEGSETEVVAEVFAAEAVGAVTARGVNAAEGISDVKVPVVFELADGYYRKITYDMGAAVEALEQAGATFDDALSEGRFGRVSFNYSGIGGPVTIERPDESLVADVTAGQPASAPKCRGIGGRDLYE